MVSIDKNLLKPYRHRVEVMVWKDDKVLIALNGAGLDLWHGLPGGGVDPGEEPAQAAYRETLEEVGVRIKNIRETNFTSAMRGCNVGAPGLPSEYAGSVTYLFEAEFDAIDKSLYNVENDGVLFKWMTAGEAYPLLRDHIKKTGGSGNHQVDYLREKL